VIDHVLIAVDDSRESLEAARVAGRLAAGWGATVRILTVIEDSTVAAAIEGVAGPDTKRRRLRGAHQLLSHVAGEVRGAGEPAESIETVVSHGSPSRCILEEADAWPADLVVMAVSDRRGVRSAYVGSETEHVLEFASCPVLVVPGSSGPRRQ